MMSTLALFSGSFRLVSVRSIVDRRIQWVSAWRFRCCERRKVGRWSLSPCDRGIPRGPIAITCDAEDPPLSQDQASSLTHHTFQAVWNYTIASHSRRTKSWLFMEGSSF